MCVKSAYFSLIESYLLHIYQKVMFCSKGETWSFIYRILCTLHVSILVDYKIIKEEGTHSVQSTWVKQKSVNTFIVYLFFTDSKYYG